MLEPSRTPRIDIALAAVLIALSGFVWWESRKIAPPFFDPLGSAALPRVVATLIAGMALVVLARAAIALRQGVRATAPDYRRRADLAVGIVVLAVFYIGVMDAGVLGFPWATMAFIFVSGAVLGGFDRRIMAVSAVLAIVLGAGGAYLFRYVFYIDLPF